MKIIAHRGNIDGSIPEKENDPNYIDIALNLGFDVEIDVWVTNNKLFLGHDSPNFEIDIQWIMFRASNLWVHCKNPEAIVYFNELTQQSINSHCKTEKIEIENINYFYHESDPITLTSRLFMWVFPGNQPIVNSIAVLPELNNEVISQCLGVCTNYAKNYQDEN